jgi:eukaryotic-like serine/threonine-protein kinase
MPSLPPANDPPASPGAEPATAETLAARPEAASQSGNTGPSPSAIETPSAGDLPKARSLVGERLNDLELLEELGRGGMGIVYKARQLILDRLVAVKLLLTEHFIDPLRLARFHAEARAAAKLDHPNIIQIYQVGECEFGPYFVMEYIDGRSVEFLIQQKRIAPPTAAALVVRVAEAVHYAHTQGVIHRDLKPANIMVDRVRRPVVMDFGIAKFLGKSSTLTQEGVIMGTPAYMAPEQAGERPEKVGPASDVYSLGAILYTLLTSRPPYESQTALLTVLKVIGPEMPTPVRSVRANVPEELERICMRCLSKEPEDRYATAQLLADDLRRFLADPTGRQSASTIERRSAGSTMTAALPPVLLVAEASGKEIRLTKDEIIVGRTSQCDLIIRASDVSKRHCRILISSDEILIEDLASANGTWVNGRQIRKAPLTTGDRLRIGNHEFLVKRAEPREV